MSIDIEVLTDRLTETILGQVRGNLAAHGWFQVEASGRHVHLSTDDAKVIFGDDYYLVWKKYLSQPGQFVCEQRVTLVGPKGRLENVVIIGPERKETQIEVSMTDAVTLGITPPCRDSGNLDDTPSIRIENGDTWVETHGGMIVAERHIHVRPDAAAALGITDGQRVDFDLDSSRPLTFRDVKVRVSAAADNFMHIDYDEANAAGFTKGIFGTISARGYQRKEDLYGH